MYGIIIWAVIVYRFTQTQGVSNAAWLTGLYVVIAGVSSFFFSGSSNLSMGMLVAVLAISTAFVYGWLRLLWRYKHENAKYWATFIIGGLVLFVI